jgi:predicted RNase H-like HicB family nuclease
MVIQWSDVDGVFIVSLPEFGPFAKTHGSTYEEAARMGQEVLELLMTTASEDEEPLPEPIKFGSPIPNREILFEIDC